MSHLIIICLKELLRIVKIKTKVSGAFRSEDGCKSYCNTLSIINTAKMRDINPFKESLQYLTMRIYLQTKRVINLIILVF